MLCFRDLSENIYSRAHGTAARALSWLTTISARLLFLTARILQSYSAYLYYPQQLEALRVEYARLMMQILL